MNAACIHAPSTLSDFLAVIEGCAIAAGGSDWQDNALLGLGTVALMAVAALGIWAMLRWAR
jgi:hypothetical protein